MEKQQCLVKIGKNDWKQSGTTFRRDWTLEKMIENHLEKHLEVIEQNFKVLDNMVEEYYKSLEEYSTVLTRNEKGFNKGT